jgi:hypothetical protein
MVILIGITLCQYLLPLPSQLINHRSHTVRISTTAPTLNQFRNLGGTTGKYGLILIFRLQPIEQIVRQSL